MGHTSGNFVLCGSIFRSYNVGSTFRNYMEPIFLEVMVLVAYCLDIKSETHLLGIIMCGSPLEILIHVSTFRSREHQKFH